MNQNGHRRLPTAKKLGRINYEPRQAMLLRADFTSQNFFSDPVPTIEKLRAAGPVVEVRLPIFGRVWMTTTQEMACRMLKDNRVFTLRNEDGTVWMPGIFRASTKTMLSVDEPDHTRLRGIVEEAFRRRAVFDMEPRIRAIADEIASDLFSWGSPADLVERYARVLSLSVICELLGLPMADRPKFMAWTALATSASSPRDFVRIAPTLAAIKRYLEQRFDHARKFGGEGLVVELVGVEEEGAPITRDEMIVMVFVLLLAGHETTMHLISGSVFELTKNPQLRDWLEEDWSRADLAIEEFLRFVSPVQFSKPRFVRRNKMATRSLQCWRPETWMLPQTSSLKSSISGGGRTAILLLARGFTFAWAINSCALKANAHSKLCTSVGLNSGWRLNPAKFDGAVDRG
jgi:cytochrome P450